jgi:putrescine oxidase
MPTLTRDAVVIGAGFSGLVAARDLERHGYSVAVLEARQRVGGRVGLAEAGGVLVETGPAWLAADHSATLDLAAELRVPVFTPAGEGEDVYLGSGGERLRYAGELLPVPQASEAAMVSAISTLEALSGAPQTELPGTLGEWLDANVADERARAALALLLAGSHADGAGRGLQLTDALRLASGAGSVSNVVDRGFRAAHRVVGGLHRLAAALEAELPDDVWLGREASAVRVAASGVEAVAGDLTVQAKAAVLAVPAPDAVRLLGGHPGEPGACGAPGAVGHSLDWFTAHAVFPTPFWRERGLSGRGFGPGAVLQELQDESWDVAGDGARTGPGVLAAHASGEAALALFSLPDAARKAAVLGALEDYVGAFPVPELGYVETRRAPGYGVGSVTFEGPLVAAGDHLEGTGHLHVEGAVRSGHRAAQKVSALLRGEQDPVSMQSSASGVTGSPVPAHERES